MQQDSGLRTALEIKILGFERRDFLFFNQLSKKQQQPPETVLALTEVKFECKWSSSRTKGVESLPRVPVPVEGVAPTLLTLRIQWVLSRIKLPPHF